MLKRKINALPSADLSVDGGRDFSIRNCVKDLRLRRVFSPRSDPKEIGSAEAGHDDFGSCEKYCRIDLIQDLEIEEKGNKADLDESFDKRPIRKDVTNKNGNTPKGILKRPNGSVNEIENPVRLTPPETIINADFTAEKGGQINTSQNGFVNKTKPRIAPSRLVRVPGSFSYRRLLPFLMEIDKNDEEKTEIANSKSVESIENPKFDENPNSEISHSEIQEANSTSISDPINPINSQSNKIEIPNFADTPNSEIPKSETINPNSTNSTKSHQPIDVSICIPSFSPLSLFSTHNTLTIEELSGWNSDKKGEIGISPKRGIIKSDNTRDCKGICTCLDCASFRIHAEKAFDFSKKQMHESDEIIGGLVKELSSLRQLLEKSSTNNDNDNKSQFYQDELIKVACQRASIAEKIVNNRTEKMFMELNAHCKIPGPKVAFSDCIEQKIIPSCRHDQV